MNRANMHNTLLNNPSSKASNTLHMVIETESDISNCVKKGDKASGEKIKTNLQLIISCMKWVFL